MAIVLLDGSNVTYAGSRSKPETLSNLYAVIAALTGHGHEPFTIFDAALRYRFKDNSKTRIEFDSLTDNTGDHFTMAPAGQSADLFLLETALELDAPVLSNDMFRDYGELKGGVLPYKHGAITVLPYKFFVGVLTIPGLDIRRKIGTSGPTFVEIEAMITDAHAANDRPTRVVAKASSPAKVGASPKTQGKASPPSIDSQISSPSALPEIEEKELQAIAQVIRDFASGTSKTMAQLGVRLAEQRKAYTKRAGLTEGAPRKWFGYKTLSVFIGARFPQYRVENGKIDEIK